MKRVAVVLDTILIGLWSFLLLFFFFSALFLLAIPKKFQDTVSVEIAVEISITILCWLSTSRFLAFLEYSQWLGLIVNVVFFPFYMWLSPAQPFFLRACTTAAASWIVVIIFLPLYKVVKPYLHIKIKWGSKESWKSKKIQREQALRTLAQEDNKG